MDSNLAAYLVLLVTGTALTLLVGQLLIRSGQVYLEQVFDDQRLATSVNRLLAVLFHLVMLGVLALISTIDVPVDGTTQAVVTKLGVVLLVLGAGHAATLLGLSRLRDRRRAQQEWDARLPGSAALAGPAGLAGSAALAGSATLPGSSALAGSAATAGLSGPSGLPAGPEPATALPA